MKKNIIIVILGLIIIALLGFIFLGGEKEYKVETEEDCLELARASVEGYANCRKVGLIELYGFDDGINCVLDFDANDDFCRGSGWLLESELSESCLESFPFAHTVLADCLKSL